MAPEPTLTGVRRRRVLIVDDHDAYRTGIERAVGRHQALEVVGVARNGAEALAAIRALEPDVVVMDIRMPEMSGLEVLDRLDGAERPAVALLSIDDDVAELARVAGAAVGLSKHLSRAAIVDAVAAVAQRSPS